MEELTKLYSKVEGYTLEDGSLDPGKLRQEVIADLVGDYLFTQESFVERLSVEHRDVFDRIFDEVKYLCRIATAGSKEARALEKVMKNFEKAYRVDAKNTVPEDGVRYSIMTNVVDVNGQIYEKVVKPGLTVYQSVKHKKENYIAHLHERIFKRTFNVEDFNGEQIKVEFAKDGERVQKDGSNSERRVLGELEATSDRLKMIAVINIKDLVNNSKPIKPSGQHRHKWLDEGGWHDRVAYMKDKKLSTQ